MLYPLAQVKLGHAGQACTRLQLARRTGKLDAMVPARLEHLFWEYDVEKLGWPADRDLIIAKILQRGRWDDIRWLRSKVSNEALSLWLLRSRGRGLSPQQIRYWQLVLDLPPDEVERWLSDPSRRIWHGRTRRGAPSRRAQ